MIELFNFLKTERSKSIRIKTDRVSFWKSDSKKIERLIDYINKHSDLFYIDCFKIEYDTRDDEKYIKAFDLAFDMNDETYEYIYSEFKYIFDKYRKDMISISEFQFTNWNKDFTKLKLH